MTDYLSDLENCTLCEWQCEVNRLEGELGVCKIEKSQIASAMLHPAPPKSYTIFLTGCNYRCLGCQNWEVAHYPNSDKLTRGFVEPKDIGLEAYDAINSKRGERMGADRIFFSGGSPTPSLPYIEEIVSKAREKGEIKVNYDTNGFLTQDSLNRVLNFTTSITFDIKAYHDEVHRALTGAPVKPVLRNAKYIAENAKEKIWEYRFLLIPEINSEDVKPLANLLCEIDPELPLNFLAFRPNFVLENHPGPTREDMIEAVETAKKVGLENVGWSGRTDLEGEIPDFVSEKYNRKGAGIAGGIAKNNGCITHPRGCGSCEKMHDCSIKSFQPKRRM